MYLVPCVIFKMNSETNYFQTSFLFWCEIPTL